MPYLKATKKQPMVNGNKDGNGFDKNPQNINRSGANRKTINKINLDLEADGYTEATEKDIKSCYLRLINVSIDELQKMVKDGSEQPSLVRVVGKAILSGKGFDVIEKMLDRTIGKATNSIDVTTNGKDINVINLGSGIDPDKTS